MSGESLYAPLPSKRNFRLLQINSCPGEHDGKEDTQLQCSLDVFDLNAACPQYVALSYTWGPPFDDPTTVEQYGQDHDKTILVSHGGRPSREQRIGRNLYEALVQIHNTKWQSYIWADAICINQRDDYERASQVNFMGDIFSRPEFVFAWLGTEPAAISDILWWYGPFIEYCSKHRLETPDSLSPLELVPQASIRQDAAIGQPVLALTGSDMTVSVGRLLALRDWLTRTRYWQRAWVQQEVMLPREARFLLGSHELTQPSASQSKLFETYEFHTVLWLWLAANSENVRQYLLNCFSNISDPMQLPAPPSTHMVGYVRREFEVELADQRRDLRKQWFGVSDDESESLAILELLIARTSFLSATDPRDKIYSLLGLVAKLARSPVEVVEVTYQLTIQEVLKAVTVRLMTGLPYMTCFALWPPSSFPRLEKLPSWVIDITAPCRTFQVGGMSSLRRVPYNACPTRNHENTVIKIHGDALQLYGHYCGDIVSLFRGFSEDPSVPGFDGDPMSMVLRGANGALNYLRLAKEVGPNYPWIDDQPTHEAIVQTMTLSKDAQELFAQEVDAEAIWKVMQHYIWQLTKLTSMNNASVAATAREYLNSAQELVLALARSEFQVPEYLVTFVTRLMTGDTKQLLREFEAALGSEWPILVPLLSSQAAGGRMIFRTENNFIGLGADDAKPRDQVWLLCRARVPQVLRPLPDGTFQTLGEAYIHGGVDGELIEKGIAGPLRQINIV